VTWRLWPDDAYCGDDPESWTSPDKREYKTAAGHCINDCPVLKECREHASGFRWTSVVIGGWTAPPAYRARPAFPPWRKRGDTDVNEEGAT